MSDRGHFWCCPRTFGHLSNGNEDAPAIAAQPKALRSYINTLLTRRLLNDDGDWRAWGVGAFARCRGFVPQKYRAVPAAWPKFHWYEGDRIASS
jgi:hypothetical protein